MAHAHHHPPGNTRAFALSTLINLAYTALEAFYGFLTGSLALLSDALHNLGDVLGLALAWGAAVLARRPPTARHTYGWRRSTLLAPLANALLLVGFAGALLWESVRRFADPPEVPGLPVMVVAAIGIAVNLGTALLFRHGHAHDLNRRGAYLHLLADAGVSFAAVLAGAGILLFGWLWIDPLLGLLVGVVIAAGSWGLLRESFQQTMDAVPARIDTIEVERYLAARPGVTAVHHLHIWPLGSEAVALTVHLVRPADDDHDAFIEATLAGLDERFGIDHATLQVERSADAAHHCRDRDAPSMHPHRHHHD